MFGLGVVKGLGITLKHFIGTYVDDLKYFYFPSSATSQEAFARRQGPEGRRSVYRRIPGDEVADAGKLPLFALLDYGLRCARGQPRL